MSIDATRCARYVAAIRESGLSIYDKIEIGDQDLWIPTTALEHILNGALTGISLAGLPLRTRSKAVKEHVCQALGYPVPRSFKRTKPRFPGQLLDTYAQKSDNLQIWNEEVSLARRYAIIRVSDDDVIARVKVVTGDLLAVLDTTGTLTQKYQARIVTGETPAELITSEDTTLLRAFVRTSFRIGPATSPTDYPEPGKLIPIKEIFERLGALLARRFRDTGSDQERNRGAEVHRAVCLQLGYTGYRDSGRFPDVLNQLLEVKLQTSPTVDLGLVCPDSTEALDVPKIQGQQVRHCDVRYALFYARTDGRTVTLENLILTTGEAFFSRLPRCEGNVLNRKIQIPLPASFFD
jgi:hypothetical protein